VLTAASRRSGCCLKIAANRPTNGDAKSLKHAKSAGKCNKRVEMGLVSRVSLVSKRVAWHNPSEM